MGSWAVAQNITSSCSQFHQVMGNEPPCSQAKLSYYRSTPFALLAQRRHPVQTPAAYTNPTYPFSLIYIPPKSLTKMQGTGTTPSPPAWISNYVLCIGYGVLMTMHEFLSFQPKGPFSMQQMAAHRHLKPREHSAPGRL